MSDLMKNRVMNTARTLTKSAAYAQISVLVNELSEDLKIECNDLQKQQELLTLISDLFRDGSLSWGYDFDNPSAPSFHVSVRKPAGADKGSGKQAS